MLNWSSLAPHISHCQILVPTSGQYGYVCHQAGVHDAEAISGLLMEVLRISVCPAAATSRTTRPMAQLQKGFITLGQVE